MLDVLLKTYVHGILIGPEAYHAVHEDPTSKEHEESCFGTGDTVLAVLGSYLVAFGILPVCSAKSLQTTISYVADRKRQGLAALTVYSSALSLVHL